MGEWQGWDSNQAGCLQGPWAHPVGSPAPIRDWAEVLEGENTPDVLSPGEGDMTSPEEHMALGEQR